MASLWLASEVVEVMAQESVDLFYERVPSRFLLAFLYFVGWKKLKRITQTGRITETGWAVILNLIGLASAATKTARSNLCLCLSTTSKVLWKAGLVCWKISRHWIWLSIITTARFPFSCWASLVSVSQTSGVRSSNLVHRLSNTVIECQTAELLLGGNQISGALPVSFGESAQSLITLSLFRNQLVWSLPSSYGLTNLKELDLSHNNRLGARPIPSDWDDFGQLETLVLS